MTILSSRKKKNSDIWTQISSCPQKFIRAVTPQSSLHFYAPFHTLFSFFLYFKRAQNYDSGGSLAGFLFLEKNHSYRDPLERLPELQILSRLVTVIGLHSSNFSPAVFLKSFCPIKRSLCEQNLNILWLLSNLSL